jgi:hypothetical protein
MKRAGIVRSSVELLLALLLAAAIWLPALHLFFRPRASDILSSAGLSPTARRLAARHPSLWADPALRAAEVARMRQSNAEWDFMSRAFFVLSLANVSLRDPASTAPPRSRIRRTWSG